MISCFDQSKNVYIKKRDYSNITAPMNKLFTNRSNKICRKMGSFGLTTDSCKSLTY